MDTGAVAVETIFHDIGRVVVVLFPRRRVVVVVGVKGNGNRVEGAVGADSVREGLDANGLKEIEFEREAAEPGVAVVR